jgi:hypothetical protein
MKTTLQPGLCGALFLPLTERSRRQREKKAGALRQAQDKLQTEIAALKKIFIYVFEDKFCLRITENHSQKISFRQKRPPLRTVFCIP